MNAKGFSQSEPGVSLWGGRTGVAHNQGAGCGFIWDENGQIVPGDIIVGADARQVKSTGDLFRILGSYEVRGILQLEIQRLTQGRITVEIQLQALP